MPSECSGGGEGEQGGLDWKRLWDPKRAEPEGVCTQGSFRAESHPTSASSSVLWAQATLQGGRKVSETEEGEALVSSYLHPTQGIVGWAEAGVRRQGCGDSVHREADLGS